MTELQFCRQQAAQAGATRPLCPGTSLGEGRGVSGCRVSPGPHPVALPGERPVCPLLVEEEPT